MIKFLLVSLLLLLSRADDEPAATSLNVGLTQDQESKITSSATNYEFQAEVNRLMEIIINSLYKTRDIFLREIISNSNDALDKIRYKSLTESNVLGSNTNLEIKVQVNKEENTITILDTGIGMTKEELIKNLGTIAHSGTASFLDKFAKASESGENPLQLIGQFGVGFYSAFLVADEVIVISKSNDDSKQWIWKSNANGQFSVSEDPRGNTLGRGVAVILKIKEDAKNFLENDEIEKIIKRYSEFMSYPIYLYSSRSETIEKESSSTSESDEDHELKTEDESTENGEKKSETKLIYYWKQLNKNKPLWARRPNSINEEEYNDFYKAFTRETDDPMSHTHFRAEGEIEFDSILYVPKKASQGMYDNYYNQKSTLRLYVRRVLIADEFEDIIPRYLNFIKGLVDSNDLPLNVNREDLQKNKIIPLISRKLTRKALDMLRSLAGDEDTDEDEKSNESQEETKEKKQVDQSKYLEFWKEFGKSIKLGVLEDQRNRKKLLDLLRFSSSKSPDTPISLKKYVDNMKDGQKYIYYLSASSLDEAENSPFMERFRNKDIEVLYFVDNLDEYMNLNEYDDYEFQSITKEGVELDGKKMKDFLQQKEEEYNDLKTWLKDLYGMKISKVTISPTLSQSPMAIVTAKYGYSAHMEKIAKAQAFGGNAPMRATKILQINYRHPIIKELKERISNGENNDEGLKDYANLLLDTAFIKSGFEIEPDEQTEFAKRVERVIRGGLKLDLDAQFDPEPEFAKEFDMNEEGSETTSGDDEEEEEFNEDEKEEL